MELPLENIARVTFKKRSEAVLPELRPMYKIGIICLILYLASTKETATVMKLQLFNWALKSPTHYKDLIKMKEGKGTPIIRFDPSLNWALGFAVAESLLRFNKKNGKFSLTDKGKKYAISILDDADILVQEKEFLSQIKKSVSDTLVLNRFKRSISVNE